MPIDNEIVDINEDVVFDATISDASVDLPDEAEKPAPYSLCDGTARIRFRAFVEGLIGREVAGTGVRVENGHPLLLVDGICRYWIGGGWAEDALSRDRPIMTGRLNPTDLMNLEGASPLGELDTWNDCTMLAGGDSGNRVIWSGVSSARCGARGARFDTAWSTIETIARSQLERSEALNGHLRITAVESPPLPRDSLVAPYRWPLSTAALDSFIIEGDQLFAAGVSHLVTDLVVATALRTLRDQYLFDRGTMPGPYGSWEGLRVSVEGRFAWVYLRDALPYEDSRGLLPF